ncbi:hypothetical protein U1Q18_019728 [Sarracenia purpurea var. burkii]
MGLWTVLCGGSNCSDEVGKKCNSRIGAIFYSYSCANHVLVASVDMLLLFVLLSVVVPKFSSRNIPSSARSQGIYPLSIFSAIFNASLGLAYLGLGIWTIINNLSTEQTVLPRHGWLLVLFQGLTWLFLSLSFSLERQQEKVTPSLKVCSILAFLITGFLCITSIREAIGDKHVSIKMVLDILSFPGSILILFCSYKGHKYAENEGNINPHGSYTPLKGEESGHSIGTTDSKGNVTSFSTAGLLSRMSFWWLNSLMKKGKEKAIEDEDIPHLRQVDQAETCYLQFIKQLGKWKHNNPDKIPSVLLTILFCQRKALVISGLFALVKVLTLSTGPLFLYEFIRVADGTELFKYEIYALAVGLFLSKCLESLSERQWCFQTRLIGLQVRSLLSAAIYQKQLRLSNAAKTTHSPGEIMNYVTVDAYKIGEFPYWCHQIWTTVLQICIALIIIYYSMGLATIAALSVIILTMLGNYPVAKLQHSYLTKLMVAQDGRLKAISEALANMKVLKMYAWETHFRNAIEWLRKKETNYLAAVQSQKGYYLVLFWSSPIIVSTVTFWACYLLGIPLSTRNVFTFLATLRIIQEPIRLIPDVAGVFIEANVSFARIVKFLEAPELQNNNNIKKNSCGEELEHCVVINSSIVSWDPDSLKPTLTNINLLVKCGEKVAICGGVGSGKSTLLETVLGEIPYTNGTVQVNGKIAYVSQTAWIQTGTIQQNILFGCTMEESRYQEVLEKCFLIKDLEMLPFGDCTVIGERGVNLSGGQKQRVQLARALYQNADIYLLDDPFSAVDAHTATGLFNEYVMGALSGKTVLLVTHQVDFLPAFDSILLMSEEKILKAATYNQLMASSQEFQNLVNAHNDAAYSKKHSTNGCPKRTKTSKEEIHQTCTKEQLGAPVGDQLIKQEEREVGNTGLKPYRKYLNQSKGFLYLSLAVISHVMYLVGQLVQNLSLASELEDFKMTRLKLLVIYLVIGCGMSLFLVLRSYAVVVLGLRASKAIFSKLMTSLFRAPMSFYDSTPLGRILSRASSDLSIVDLELSFKLSLALASTMTTYFSYGILIVLAWPILFVIIPMVYLTLLLQSYYFASSKELMRIEGTTKSSIASHVAESIAGAMTIRAYGEEYRFFAEYLHLIDTSASPYFHSFSANEWLIQRLEIVCAIVLSSSALAMTSFHLRASDSG